MADKIAWGGASYSPDEQLIGTWADGKPLYQKTIVCYAPASITVNTEYVIYTLPTDCVICGGEISRDRQQGSVTTYGSDSIVFHGSNETYDFKSVDGYKLVGSFQATGWASSKFIITLRYTKTTD